MNGEIIARGKGLIEFEVGAAMSYDGFCNEATAVFRGKKTGIKISTGYDSGGFRVKLGERHKSYSSGTRGMTSDKVNEAYWLLGRVTQFLCRKQPGLLVRLLHQELD